METILEEYGGVIVMLMIGRVVISMFEIVIRLFW